MAITAGLRTLLVSILAGALSPAVAFAQSNTIPSQLMFESPSHARFQFDGFVGRRIEAMVENWLLTAPAANPGMLEMFAVRDREPKPNLVPWAGEFVGKYLISAIQAQRLTRNARLDDQVAQVVRRLIASQAEDGYLGPFPKAERLRGHWDLWGHYHCMLGLLAWHAGTGDPAALKCVRRAADLMCALYLDSGRRPFEAGSDEMNLAVIHSLGWLYRLTGEPRYRELMRVIEQDWERGGDYFRKGLEGVEFFQIPRPRWESLHDLQGLVELYRISADQRYRDSFEHHWRSIARWDLRNTGGFSSGEQATGNPYAPSPIETCCSIAWMCLSVDMLALTADPTVADKLELATLNAWAGAQHPSGRWCTYNTPMDGAREASAHTIVFQSRAGTPELNCCSVNGPRGWGMLSQWATMLAPDGIVQNWLGPGSSTVEWNRSKVRLWIEGDYPRDSKIVLHLEPEKPQEFTLRLRIPSWSDHTSAALNNAALSQPHAGSYLSIHRRWKKGDRVRLALDLKLRAIPGDFEARGKLSLYRGPLLLAWDQRFNAGDENKLPALDKNEIRSAKTIQLPTAIQGKHNELDPLLLLDLPTSGSSLRLCDFATAGSTGTRYRTWLASANTSPPPVVTRTPRDGAKVPYGTVAFRSRASRADGSSPSYRLEISGSEDFARTLLAVPNLAAPEALVEIGKNFKEQQWYYWRVVSHNNHGETTNSSPPARFKIDSTLPEIRDVLDKIQRRGLGGEMVVATLNGDPAPQFGAWKANAHWQQAEGRSGALGHGVRLNGSDQKLVYTVEQWPEDDYSLSLWFKIDKLPIGRLGQVFSGWCAGSDDPLRLVIDGGKLFARIEAGNAYSTKGVPIEPGRWLHAAVVKTGSRLSLYLDGQEKSSTNVPEFITTNAKDFALGGNPHYSGNEHLALQASELKFYARALSADEISALSH